MTNNDTAARTFAVRLGVSMTRAEAKDMTRRWGRSHTVRHLKSLEAWQAGSCTCHNLTWATSDLTFHWGDDFAKGITCPLTN